MAVGKKQIKREAIEQAVKQAEHGHHGEIFPLILKQSDFYPASHFRSALLWALAVPMGMYYSPFEFSDPIWYLWAQIPALLFGYCLAYFSSVKRFFSTRSEIEEEVAQKAVESFIEYGLHQTKNKTGVMIIVSLLEHRVRILADSAYDEIMKEDDWKALTKNLATEIKKNNLSQGMIETIEEVGRIMLRHFPLKEGEVQQNEIANSEASHKLENASPTDSQ